MFFSNKLICAMAASGLMLVTGCGGGGGPTAVCVNISEDVCGTVSFSWSIVGVDNSLPGGAGDNDALETAAAVQACTAVGVPDSDPDVNPDVFACEGGTAGTCSGITISETPESGYQVSGSADVESSNEGVFGEETCTDLGGAWTAGS